LFMAAQDEIVSSACEAVGALDHNPSDASVCPAISRAVATMKLMLYGSPDTPADKQAGMELTAAVLRSNLLSLLLSHFPSLEFECRKDVAQVFSNLLRKQLGGELSAVAWLEGDCTRLCGCIPLITGAHHSTTRRRLNLP